MATERTPMLQDEDLDAVIVPMPQELGPNVTCNVCQSVIDVTGKEHLNVVKCIVCGENTPIRDPPVGKVYSRCQSCKILMVHGNKTYRVQCPRSTCRRIFKLGPPANPALESLDQPHRQAPPIAQPSLANIICIHCQDTFLFNPNVEGLIRCRHCGMKSALNRDFCRKRAFTYFVISAFLCLAFIIALSTTAKSSSAFIILDLVFAIPMVYCLLKAVFFISMKLSFVDRSRPL